MYKFLCRDMLSFLLGIYLSVELFGHLVIYIIPSEGLPDVFPKQLHHFIFPAKLHKCSSFSKYLPTLLVSHKKKVILMCM